MIDADHIARARDVRLEDELARRGVKLRGAIERCGPCPSCGGVDRFAINTRNQIWNCRGCGRGGDVLALVQHIDGVSFAGAVETLSGDRIERPQVVRRERQESPDEYERRQATKAKWLWSLHKPIIGSPAETYLREARHYSGPLPATSLGYLPARDEHLHAMIAAYGIGEITAVHLTKLAPDGMGKAGTDKDKITVASPLSKPIVLAPPNDLLGIAVTEGIEDALSVHEATGLGAWAAGAAGFMPAPAETVPDYIETVTIYAHPDKAGQDGARKLAGALARRGIEIFLEGIAL